MPPETWGCRSVLSMPPQTAGNSGRDTQGEEAASSSTRPRGWLPWGRSLLSPCVMSGLRLKRKTHTSWVESI